MGLARRLAAMPSLEHETPLMLFREEPALVPALLREALGIEVPAFATVDVAESGFNEAQPVELRADMVIELRDGTPGRHPVMGLVVEVQRARDEDKPYVWPRYAAALHARLRCAICLVVIATDDAVARWAAMPIRTVQLGSAFVPLVIGPEQVPRLSVERARCEPWLALLSVLIHGNGPGGHDAITAAAAALAALPDAQASVCYDAIWAVLDSVGRRALEDEMQPGKYVFKSDLALHYIGVGREEGREEGRLAEARELVLALVERHGPIAAESRARLAASSALEQLRGLALDVARAPDRETIERLLAALTAPASDA